MDEIGEKLQGLNTEQSDALFAEFEDKITQAELEDHQMVDNKDDAITVRIDEEIENETESLAKEDQAAIEKLKNDERLDVDAKNIERIRNQYTVKELKNICKKNGLHKYSWLDELGLIHRLIREGVEL